MWVRDPGLFDEKLELFALVRQEKPVTWSGTTWAALPGLQVYPPTASGALPTWVGVGGNPASVVRAARYGFSLMLAIIGGNPALRPPVRALPPGHHNSSHTARPAARHSRTPITLNRPAR